MLAASLGYLYIYNMLIDADPDVNARKHTGNTPLHLAAQGYSEQLPIVQTLLQRGADPNVVNEDGVTLAELAKSTEKDAGFELLKSQISERVESPSYQQFDGIKQEYNQQGVFSFT